MYIQLVYVPEMRKQQVEEGQEGLRGQRVCRPFLLPQQPPPQMETHQMDPQETKKPTKHHFFLISKCLLPRRKQQARGGARVLLLLPEGLSQVGKDPQTPRGSAPYSSTVRHRPDQPTEGQQDGLHP